MSNKRITSKISNRFTQLIDVNSFDTKNLVYEPQDIEIQSGNKPIKYISIKLGNKTNEGVGEVVINFPFMCHAFGVEEFSNEQGKVTDYSVGLSILDKNNPTDEQLAFVKKFNLIVEQIKKHLVSIKKDIKKPTLDMSDLKTFNPMKQSLDEDGQPKDGAWYFSPKLMKRKIFNKDDPSDVSLKIETQFFLDGEFDAKGNPVEVSPLDFLGKNHFKFRGAIKLESIYIGSKISLQCKVYDGVVARVSSERKRLTQVGGPSAGMNSAASKLLSDEDDAEILLEDD